ncbi:MAG TPA: serine/threonine-protein kinase [Planctomycetota bacterium]
MADTRKRSRIKITELDGQVGRLAVERGLLTLEQFMEVLTQRDAEDASAPLDLVLVSAGLITEEQAESLVNEAAQAPPPLDRQSLADLCRIVGEPVGRGPSGVTLRCRLPDRPRVLAMKIISRNSLNDPFIEEFAAASRKAATLEHPAAVRVLEVELRAADLTIVSEFAEGMSLLDRVRREGPLKAPAAAEILVQVAGALAESHRAKRIHGNLKPENVFLLSSGGVKVGDFGHGRAEPQWLVRNADKAGTLVYSMAPEQWTGRPGPSTDLYACGVLWHLLLTGDYPLKGRTFIEIRRRHEEEEAPPPSASVKGVPADADKIAKKLLRKDPKDRYLTADELAADLRKVAKGEPLGAGLTSKLRKRVKPRPKGWTRRPLS